jgi:hypothetical protein
VLEQEMRPAICVIVALLWAVPSFAQNVGAEELRGLTSMYVLVEDAPAFPSLATRIQTTVELKLRQNGIAVIPSNDSNKFHHPHLYVNITAMKVINRTNHVYNVSIQFNRDVMIYEKATKQVTDIQAAVWTKNMVGISTSEDDIRDSMLDVLDVFLNDYLAANPKK